MFQLGIPEVLVILVILLVVFGGSRLPDLGRGLGRSIRNFREAARDGSGRNNES